MTKLTAKDVVDRFNRAKERRSTWESHWQECYDFALPQRGNFNSQSQSGDKRTDKLFDGTAPDAVDQLSASLLAHLTPPWAKWFGLTPGNDVTEENRDELSKALDHASLLLQYHFDRSNFAVEVHQCYLDLVSVGSACLMFEENAPGESSAFRFSAVPIANVVFEEGVSGNLTTTFRRIEMPITHLKQRFPEADIPKDMLQRAEKDNELKFSVIEAVIEEESRFVYIAVLEKNPLGAGEAVELRRGSFAASPFINFRWLKAPGEIYGRSPVMKALPDIKTANKVVELALKNAAISVTGIWQADDDGVLNPATIKLTPGTIIPKAVGSQGLTPLQAPGSFDLSQIVLEDLRKRIRHALLVDKLGQPDNPKMTATEVLERSAEMARILGATYGRLQSELLTPLIMRAISILVRRGEIDALRIDGRKVDLQYKSPLARQQIRQEAKDILLWLESISQLGPEAMGMIDAQATARYLAKAYAVPGEILRDAPGTAAQPPQLPGAIGAGEGGQGPAQDGMQALQTMAGQVPEMANISKNPKAMAAIEAMAKNLMGNASPEGAQ